MKKLFTLFAALMLTLNLFAVKYSIGAPTNNAKDWYDAATKTITFLEAGSYRPGWWMGWNNETSSNSGQNMSAYDEFVVELAATDYDITVCFEYMDESIATETVTGKDGKLVVKLNEEGKKAVKQAYLQVGDDGVGKSVEFKDAYFQNDEEEITSYVIYDNPEQATPLDWSAGMVSASLDNTALSLVKTGNKIRLEYGYYPYESEDEQYYQVQCMGSWWTILTATKDIEGAEVTASNVIIDLKDKNGVLDITLNDADVATLNTQKGVLFAGHGILITKITIGDLADVNYINSAVAPTQSQNAPVYNLAGQQVSKNYKGVVIQNGKKFVQK